MIDVNKLGARVTTREYGELVSDTGHTQEGYSRKNVLEFCALCRIQKEMCIRFLHPNLREEGYLDGINIRLI